MKRPGAVARPQLARCSRLGGGRRAGLAGLGGSDPRRPAAVPSHCRAGVTITEIVVTAILLSTAMMLVAPLLRAVAVQRRAAERRQVAQQDVANLMERLSLRPWESLSEDSLADVTLSEGVRAVLPDEQLTIDVQPADGPPQAKRITIELQWKNPAGDFVSPVRLAAWVHRRGGTE